MLSRFFGTAFGFWSSMVPCERVCQASAKDFRAIMNYKMGFWFDGKNASGDTKVLQRVLAWSPMYLRICKNIFTLKQWKNLFLMTFGEDLKTFQHATVYVHLQRVYWGLVLVHQRIQIITLIIPSNPQIRTAKGRF